MTMTVATIVGARPQFVKAAMVIRALKTSRAEIAHHLIHTGQHYDHEMSGAFFKELDLPAPDLNLGIGGGTHGQMTGLMLVELERVLEVLQPGWVLVYGDTDSTLAGALAASKLHVPLAHVEAGLRSFNRTMPEELNRVLTDHASDVLLCPTRTAVSNLEREGLLERTRLVGDVMYDAALHHRNRLSLSALDDLGVVPRSYFLATCHRAENTDNPDRLRSVVGALTMVAQLAPVLFPLHPRTRRRLDEFEISIPTGVTILQPLPYVSMLSLESNAVAILTDSGGVQKEAYFLGVPCITMRSETEWKETIETGWNTLVDTDPKRIFEAAGRIERVRTLPRPPLYGNGDAASKIVATLITLSAERE